MTRLRAGWWLGVLAAATGVLAGAEKPSIRDLVEKSEAGPGQNSAFRKSSGRTLIDGSTELVGFGFVVPGLACRFFDSELDYAGYRSVVISILTAFNAPIGTTRVVPLFRVPGSPFPSSVKQLRGSEFEFNDGGGGTVPVSGRSLRINVCNDGFYPVQYTHLTVYRPAIGSAKGENP